MKDSQPRRARANRSFKYIKANNERFSTPHAGDRRCVISISRRIMKDSQPMVNHLYALIKYIKANNERFSTAGVPGEHRR